MKVRLKNGEVLNIADYYRITLDSCDGWGNPIEVDWKDIEQIIDDDGLPLGMPKKINGMTLIPKPFDLDEHRYDIAKAMLPNTAYMDGNQYGGRLSPEQAAHTAVAYADALIEELKKA